MPYSENKKNSFGNFQRQMYDATCSACNKKTQVPFKPREGSKVFCKECYFKNKNNEKPTIKKEEFKKEKIKEEYDEEDFEEYDDNEYDDESENDYDNDYEDNDYEEEEYDDY